MADNKISTTPEIHHGRGRNEQIGSDPEKILSAVEMEDVKGDHMDYNRVDKEVAKYVSDVAIEISPEENSRLKKLIDRRVLPIMIFTYFLQALDKGTLSFASIMGIRDDTHLVGQQFSWLTTCIYIAILIVEYPTNWLIQRLPIGKYLGISIIVVCIKLPCFLLLMFVEQYAEYVICSGVPCSPCTPSPPASPTSSSSEPSSESSKLCANPPSYTSAPCGTSVKNKPPQSPTGT